MPRIIAFKYLNKINCMSLIFYTLAIRYNYCFYSRLYTPTNFLKELVRQSVLGRL